MEKKPGGIKKQLINIAILVLLVGLTLYALQSAYQDLSWQALGTYFSQIPLGWIAAALSLMIGFVLFEGLALGSILSYLKNRRNPWQCFVYSAADIYYSGITPSASGGQPASAYYMVKDGVSVAVSSATLVFNILNYTLSLLLLGGATMIFFPSVLGQFDLYSRVLIYIGLGIQVVFLVVFFMLMVSDRLILKVGGGLLSFLAKIRLLRKKEERLANFHKAVGEYKASFGLIKKSPFLFLKVLGMNLLQRICVILIPVCIFTGAGQGNFWELTALTALCLLGANSLPVPGAVGVTELLFLDAYTGLVERPELGLLLSRGISFYLCLILCATVTLVHHVRIHLGKRVG